MKKATGIVSCLLVSAVSIVLTLVVWFGAQAVRYFFFGLPIQTVQSRESGNTAVLREHFGIFDYNLSIDINGKSVHRTGDIQGFSPSQLRATLVWDKTGRVLLFEMMGKPAFAYDTATSQKLGIEGIEGLEFYPMPKDFPFTSLGSNDVQ